MADFDLSGKTALVTGASRGIRLSIAQALAGAGARVVLSSRKQADLEAAAETIRTAGGQALPIAAHTGDSSAVQQLVERVLALELAHANIQVNAIAPGLIKTKLSRVLWDTPAIYQAVLKDIPQARFFLVQTLRTST